MIIKIILIATALGGFAYGLYSQTQARKYISKEKIVKLNDTSIIANGPMPSKAILSCCSGGALGMMKYHGAVN